MIEIQFAKSIAARVARGAEWLDTVKPGWADQIDLDTLMLESCFRCVLSQAFGKTLGDFGGFTGFSRGLAKLIEGYSPDNFFSNNTVSAQYGFSRDGRDVHDSFWQELHNEWVTVILTRRAASTVEQHDRELVGV